jgi:hypothetical protein
MNFVRQAIFAVLILVLFCAQAAPWGDRNTAQEKAANKSSCQMGGPVYCSPTDLTPAPLTKIPDVGGPIGAGTKVLDPTFNNPILRITDWNTEGSGGRNDNFMVDCGGSAEINFMSADDTKFYTCDGGTAMDMFTVDLKTQSVSRMYASQFPGTNGMRTLTNSSSGEWSFTQADILYDMETGNYQAGTPIIKYYDLSSLTKPPRPQTLYNFSQSPNCVPSSAGTTHWITDVTVSKDDQTFSTSFSLTGVAGTATWVVVWNRTQGCRWWNTQTGQVGGDWGPSGTVNISDRFYLHNSRLSKDGNWVRVGFQSCISGCAGGVQVYLWQIATNTLTPCTIGNNCLGHSALGYTHMVNSPTTPTQQMQLIRPLSNINQQTQLWTNGPPSHIPWDNHQSWENVDTADSYPYISSSETGVPIVYAWDNEIDAFSTDGSGIVYRFAHTFATGQSQFFSSANAIGSVSADGKFFAWSSDWQGTLGSTTGGKTCTLGTNCRSDVFIVELQ